MAGNIFEVEAFQLGLKFMEAYKLWVTSIQPKDDEEISSSIMLAAIKAFSMKELPENATFLKILQTVFAALETDTVDLVNASELFAAENSNRAIYISPPIGNVVSHNNLLGRIYLTTTGRVFVALHFGGPDPVDTFYKQGVTVKRVFPKGLMEIDARQMWLEVNLSEGKVTPSYLYSYGKNTELVAIPSGNPDELNYLENKVDMLSRMINENFNKPIVAQQGLEVQVGDKLNRRLITFRQEIDVKRSFVI